MQLQKLWVCIMATFMLFSFQARSQDAQEVAIKKAISDQSEAFKKRDVNAWQASWLQDAKTYRSYTNMFGNHTYVGWNNIGPEAVKFLKDNPAPDSVEISMDSITVRREGNMAVADFKQEFKVPNGQPPFDKFVSREQRVLVKKNGKWLVSGVTSTDITALGINGTELSINAVGYNYMYAGKNDEAVKVLELNSVLFPDSFNVWDSLGEAYAKAGNKEKAIECYEKSIAINPNNENGKKALSGLK